MNTNDWLSVSKSGDLSGTPSASDAGLNIVLVHLFDDITGVECTNSVAVYVQKAADNPPVFLNPPFDVQTASTMDDSVVTHIYVIDPDSEPTLQLSGFNTSALSVSRSATRNEDGLWDFSILKSAVPSVGSGALTATVSDGTLTATTSFDFSVATPTHGVTVDSWYLCWAEKTHDLTELTNDSRYPNNPDLTTTRKSAKTLGGGSNGNRIRGYLTPPGTGNYTFSFNGGSKATLFMSADDSKTNLTEYASGSSIALDASHRYYFEFLNWNGTVSLQWNGPGLANKATIQAEYLTPAEYARPDFGKKPLMFKTGISSAYYREYFRNWLKDWCLAFQRDVKIEKISGPAWGEVVNGKYLEGVPTESDAGTNTFVMRAVMPGGMYQDVTVKMVIEQNEVPQFSSSSELIYTNHVNQRTKFRDVRFISEHVTDANSDTRLGFGDRLEFSIISGPPWLQMNEIGHLFGQTSDECVGTNRWVIQVVDSGGLTNQVDLVIEVTNDNLPPVAVPYEAKSVREGHAVVGSVADMFADPNNDPLVIQKVEGTNWLSVAADGTLSGTPPANFIGSEKFKIAATDPAGNAVTNSISITVLPENIFLYDPFDATNGTKITTYKGGVGWADRNWKGGYNNHWPRKIVRPGLEFPGIKAIGGMCDAAPELNPAHSKWNWAGETSVRYLKGTYVMGSNTNEGEITNLWITTLFKYNLHNPYTGKILLREFTIGDPVFSFGKVNSTFNINFLHKGAHLNLPASIKNSDEESNLSTWFLAVHLQAKPDGIVEGKLYAVNIRQVFDPGVDMTDPETFPYKTDLISTKTRIAFTQFCLLRRKDMDGFVDEVRIAENYIDCISTSITEYEPIDDLRIGLENANLDISPLDNDPVAAGLSITNFTQPAHGTVTDLGGNVLRYTPDHNFYGEDKFTYTTSESGLSGYGLY